MHGCRGGGAVSDHLTLCALLAAWGAGICFGLGLALLLPQRDPADLWRKALDEQTADNVRLGRDLALERGRTAILQRERRDHYGEAIAERRGKV